MRGCEASSFPHSHRCLYQPSGEYYLSCFFILVGANSKSAVPLWYSGTKVPFGSTLKITVEYPRLNGSPIFVLFHCSLNKEEKNQKAEQLGLIQSEYVRPFLELNCYSLHFHMGGYLSTILCSFSLRSHSSKSRCHTKCTFHIF